jgi:transcriptional regulator with PAS, ATPase and Fis domain
MATDIMARRPTNKSIDFSDTSLRPAIDFLSQPVFLVDLTDHIIIANNAAQTTTGLQESALVGNPIATILSLNGRTQATSDKSPLGSLISPTTLNIAVLAPMPMASVMTT